MSPQHLGFYGSHGYILRPSIFSLFLIDDLVLHTARGFPQKFGVWYLTLFMESFAKQFLYSGCLIAHFEG